MNGWQVLQQLAYECRIQLWIDSPYENVFDKDSVRVSAAITKEALAQLLPPMVFLHPGAAEADPEIRGLARMPVHARLTCISEDEMGENVLIGANRGSNGQGSSDGRGLLEIEEEFLRAIDRFNNQAGVLLTGGFVGAVEPAYADGIGYIATRNYLFDAQVTRARYYHPPLHVAATANGGGQVTIAWGAPPARFDHHPLHAWEALRGGMVVRYAAGSTAPASPTAGSSAGTVSGPFGVSLVVTGLTPGTYSFAVFTGYDETGSGSNERFSDQEDGTTVTVAVT